MFVFLPFSSILKTEFFFILNKYATSCKFNIIMQYISPNKYNNTMIAKNQFNLSNDTFLHICNYIDTSDMINISISCKEFIKYYYIIWHNIQKKLYPKSLIPHTDYINIRKNMALDIYYLKLLYSVNTDQYNNINNIEHNMVRICIDLVNTKTELWYNMLMNELLKLRHTRDNLFKYNSHIKTLIHFDINIYNQTHQNDIFNTQKYLSTFIDVSNNDYTKIPYYTIKQTIDCRIYGLDPIKHPLQYETKRKWVTGEYNTNYDYNFNHQDTSDSSFTYKFDNNGLAFSRCRIRPDYC